MKALSEQSLLEVFIKQLNLEMYDAVIPQVEGNAYITGKHEFLIDPEDPLKEGFILQIKMNN